jgi:hypothetical protein
MKGNSKAKPEVRPLRLRKIDYNPTTEFTVSDPTELLAANGFSTPQAAERILHRMSDADLRIFASDLYDFLHENSRVVTTAAPNSLLTSSASASMSGESGCARYSCRAKKLDALARYAALYAQQVILPLRFERPSEQSHAAVTRDRLERAISAILHLRDLVAAGIVVPIVPTIHLCEQCSKRAFAEYQQGLAAAQQQARSHQREFTFVYEEPADGFCVLHTSGPERYIEHGQLHSVYSTRPAWIPNHVRAGEQFRVSVATAKRAGLVDGLFTDFASDAFMHQHYTRRFNATYLTDLEGEAEFFHILSAQDARTLRTAALCAQLTHELPIFTDLSIKDVLRIRAEIPESFVAYREKLTSVVWKYASHAEKISRNEAADIYNDELRPAIADLTAAATAERTRRIRKSMLLAAIAIGVVSLGATGMLNVPQITALIGGAAGMQAVNEISNLGKGAMAANSSYFFLFKLQQAAADARKRTH